MRAFLAPQDWDVDETLALLRRFGDRVVPLRGQIGEIMHGRDPVPERRRTASFWIDDPTLGDVARAYVMLGGSVDEAMRVLVDRLESSARVDRDMRETAPDYRPPGHGALLIAMFDVLTDKACVSPRLREGGSVSEETRRWALSVLEEVMAIDPVRDRSNAVGAYLLLGGDAQRGIDVAVAAVEEDDDATNGLWFIAEAAKHGVISLESIRAMLRAPRPVARMRGLWVANWMEGAAAPLLPDLKALEHDADSFVAIVAKQVRALVERWAAIERRGR
jgi:hypothetical protein